MMKKRIEVVSLQLVKENSFLYEPRICLSPEAAYQLFEPFIAKKATEHLIVASLNTKGEAVNVSTVHIGSVNQSLAIPREVVKVALLSNAVSMIIAHNHPGGSVEPSQADMEFTNKLQKACNLLQIQLHDHLILSSNGEYLSMRAENLMKNLGGIEDGRVSKRAAITLEFKID